MLHHVEIYVSDLSRSYDFWSWLLERLEYRKKSQWEHGFSYEKDDGAYLTFVQTQLRHLDAGYHRCHIGLNHLAFSLPLRSDVDAMHDELRARGVSLLYEEQYPFAGGQDYYAVFFEDPDRIKIEIVAVK